MTSASLRAFSTSHRCLQALQILGSYQFRQQTVFESVEIIFHCLQTVILIQWDCRAEWERQKKHLYKNYTLKFKCDDDTLRRRLNLQIWMYFDWNRSLCNSSPITFSSLDLLRRPHAVSYKIFLPKRSPPHLTLLCFYPDHIVRTSSSYLPEVQVARRFSIWVLPNDCFSNPMCALKPPIWELEICLRENCDRIKDFIVLDKNAHLFCTHFRLKKISYVGPVPPLRQFDLKWWRLWDENRKLILTLYFTTLHLKLRCI